MPRYEYSEGTSNKFWEIELAGTSYTSKWGRIGGSMSSSTKSYGDAAAARKEYDKLVNEKVRKGYQLVGGAASKAAKPNGKAAKPVAKPAAPSGPARNADLEKAILEQLATLDLSMGNLSDRGIDTMVKAKDAFQHLAELNLDDSALTDASKPKVKGLAKKVNYGTQDSPQRAVRRGEDNKWSRYVAVGE